MTKQENVCETGSNLIYLISLTVPGLQQFAYEIAWRMTCAPLPMSWSIPTRLSKCISSSAGPRGTEGRDEVLEKARRERAERERARASRGPALTIQRWYRGRSAADRAREKQRADWQKKMSDYGTLQRALVAR